MAYRYNEKTGEFEQINSSGPAPAPKPAPAPSRPTTTEGSGSEKGGCILGGLLMIAYTVLPYLLLAGLASLCS